MFDRESCFEFGLITKPHGLKGACVFHLDVDDPSEYTELESVLVEQNGSLVPFFISSFQLQGGKKAIVQLEDIDTIDDLQSLINAKLFLPLEILPELEKGQFYFHDVIGYTVVDVTQGELGKVTQFIDAAAQVLLEMEYQGSQVLVPVVDAIVLEADHGAKTLKVNLPEGLLEVYLNTDESQ